MRESVNSSDYTHAWTRTLIKDRKSDHGNHIHVKPTNAFTELHSIFHQFTRSFKGYEIVEADTGCLLSVEGVVHEVATQDHSFHPGQN